MDNGLESFVQLRHLAIHDGPSPRVCALPNTVASTRLLMDIQFILSPKSLYTEPFGEDDTDIWQVEKNLVVSDFVNLERVDFVCPKDQTSRYFTNRWIKQWAHKLRTVKPTPRCAFRTVRPDGPCVSSRLRSDLFPALAGDWIKRVWKRKCTKTDICQQM